MLAGYTKPVLTVHNRLRVVSGYWQACTNLAMRPTVPLVSVLVAHAALETGHFEKGCWCNNLGNIKASELWTGQYTCITLNEVLKDPKTGQFVTKWFSPQGELTGKNGTLTPQYLEKPYTVPPGHPQTRMRAYKTLDDGIEDKIRFLLKPSYEAVLKPARLGDASTYTRMIRQRGYFTAYKGQPDPTPYERDLISLVKTYRPLVEQVAAGQVEETPNSTTVTVPEPTKFEADVSWRLLAFKAYEQAQAMDVHEIVRQEALKELREDDQ